MVPSAAERNGGSREVMIDVDHLTRYYGTLPALTDVTFRAYRGEIVGFLGPNGAGKTTTMRILTGYMPPSSGSASVAGHDVVEASIEARRAIGYLPENTPLYPDMTVYGYLDFMSKLRGVSDRASAIERVMARVGIDDRADDLIAQLSKGLRQRVGIAQSLVHDPEVIILDEPTIGLDPHQIREVRGLIRELGGDHTIILSTHILPEAEQICDRVLIIDEGEIVAEDALERLAEQTSTGGERIRVVVDAEAEASAVAEVLAGVDGVDGVEVEDGGAFVVTTARGESRRAAIADAVVGRRWSLLELTPVVTTLEDIFLQVTAERLGGLSSGDPAFGEAATGEADDSGADDTAHGPGGDGADGSGTGSGGDADGGDADDSGADGGDAEGGDAEGGGVEGAAAAAGDAAATGASAAGRDREVDPEADGTGMEDSRDA